MHFYIISCILCSPLCAPLPTVPRYHRSIIIAVFSSLFFVFGVSQAHGLIWTAVMEFVCVWSTSFPEGLTRVTRHRPAIRDTTKASPLCSCSVYMCLCVWGGVSLNESCCHQIKMNNKQKTLTESMSSNERWFNILKWLTSVCVCVCVSVCTYNLNW